MTVESDDAPRPEESTPASPHAARESATAPPASAVGNEPAAAAPVPVPAPGEAERPSDRIQIGSQREGTIESPKPAALPIAASSPAPAAAPPAASKKYPPPNIRGQLPPELQAEFDAAVGEGSVESLLEQSVEAAKQSTIAPSTKMTARVASLHGEDVFLDLGVQYQGVIPAKQFETPPEIGAELNILVTRFNEEQGMYEATLPAAAVDVGNWDEVHEGQVVEVTVSGANKGGLECTVANIRGFIPMGQISMFRVENAEEYVGQRLACVITEANRKRKNLVLSHRALMERERKEKREELLAEIAPGQIREGVVRSLQDFGAFIDLGGADGLIHVSQLSWERVGHPNEVLTVGQQVKVKVEKINKETGKIALSYREVGENPWAKVPERYPVGTTAKGTVTKLMQFGAFVRLEAGVEGLIHISELGHGRVQRVSDVLSEGQDVEAKVQSVDVDAQRIGLSLKALLPKPEKPPREEARHVPEQPDPEAEKRRERRRREAEHLKGGRAGAGGGEMFGLKW
ncbi:MAG: S1 RNA-binding domain-containing protein [Pirellulales bacterium]|nr:S1 RNA-binding domain-containing protein [Pirellulales bacterium]